MNLEWFYEEMREAMKYMGVGWGQKDKVYFYVTDTHLTFTCEGMQVSVPLPSLPGVNPA